jgi:hypothetical protein
MKTEARVEMEALLWIQHLVQDASPRLGVRLGTKAEEQW